MEIDLQLDLLRVLVKHGVCPEKFLRDEEINAEYLKMIKSGIKSKDAREALAEKYFTSQKNIETILYGKKKNID